MANVLGCEQIRMSACSAISSPPPMQYPSIAAITGLVTCRHTRHAAPERRS